MGPQGPQGETGAMGPQGPQGVQGPPGPTSIVASINMSFSLDDRSGWDHIELLGDDTCFFNIPLGFTFTGFGASTSTISFSSNGNLFFGQNCSVSWTNTTLPTGISSDPILAFFWDDLLDFGGGEFAQYRTFGSPGARVFYLYFRNRLFSSACSDNKQNVTIAIHEGSNLVDVTYQGFSGCAEMRASSATLGMQSANASDWVTVGVNVPLLDDNASRQSMSFQPPP
jgi:hypothetical protein